MDGGGRFLATVAETFPKIPALLNLDGASAGSGAPRNPGQIQREIAWQDASCDVFVRDMGR